jgi:hypothetical protein
MKRIIAISTLVVAACFGFSSVANAAGEATGTSTQTGSVTAACSVTGNNSNATSSTTKNVGGVEFPTAITLSGGNFKTLCNTSNSSVSIAQDSVSVPAGQVPAVTYTLNGPAVYSAALTGAADVAIATPTNGNAAHGFSDEPSTLGVSVKIAAPASQILQNGSYTVVLKATVTPL